MRSSDADLVLEAISSEHPHVLVQADILGDGLYFSPVRIVLKHVISIMENEKVPGEIQTRPQLSVVAPLPKLG